MGIYLFIGIIATIVYAIIIAVDDGWTDVFNKNNESEEDLNITIGGIFVAGCIMVLIWPAVIIYAIYEFIKK